MFHHIVVITEMYYWEMRKQELNEKFDVETQKNIHLMNKKATIDK